MKDRQVARVHPWLTKEVGDNRSYLKCESDGMETIIQRPHSSISWLSRGGSPSRAPTKNNPIGSKRTKTTALALHLGKFAILLLLCNVIVVPYMFSTTTTPSLEFVHITKTAGTAIEDAAAKAGISWGRCKFKRWRVTNPAKGCLPLNTPTSHFEDEKEWQCAMKTDAWHCPPHRFQNGKNLYDGSKTFAIVRNPYDRIVSEYYYFGHMLEGKNKPWHSPEQKNKPGNFNRWIQEQLKIVEKKGSCAWGHCIPMHKYTHLENGDPMVDHVLHLENIKSELPTLMNQYGLEKIQMMHNNARKESDNLNVGHLYY